jgi:hypothetical protein
MRRRRLDYVIDVGIIKHSGETVAPKVDGPGGDVMKRANSPNHGRVAMPKSPVTSLRYAL